MPCQPCVCTPHSQIAASGDNNSTSAVTETTGAYVCVTDDEILNAIPALARGAGVFAEPAGAAAYAGLVKAVEDGLVSADERIVVLNTGNGLKDIKSAMSSVEMVGTKPSYVAPNLDDLKRVMAEIGAQR
ncbi:MAG TPA: pyridoxal-phosphate dependent enzyme [Anaerolineae bacterium]|nr:pyridoxal-phosphate dependent enzyme [Anaerolineae bacterium]